MLEGIGIGVVIAIIGGNIWHFFAKIVEEWDLNRIANREARRKAAAQPKAII